MVGKVLPLVNVDTLAQTEHTIIIVARSIKKYRRHKVVDKSTKYRCSLAWMIHYKQVRYEQTYS